MMVVGLSRSNGRAAPSKPGRPIPSRPPKPPKAKGCDISGIAGTGPSVDERMVPPFDRNSRIPLGFVRSTSAEGTKPKTISVPPSVVGTRTVRSLSAGNRLFKAYTPPVSGPKFCVPLDESVFNKPESPSTKPRLPNAGDCAFVAEMLKSMLAPSASEGRIRLVIL